MIAPRFTGHPPTIVGRVHNDFAKELQDYLRDLKHHSAATTVILQQLLNESGGGTTTTGGGDGTDKWADIFMLMGV